MKDTKNLYRFVPQMLTAKTSKRLQITQAQLQETSYAPEHNRETSMLKHNYKRLLIK